MNNIVNILEGTRERRRERRRKRERKDRGKGHSEEGRRVKERKRRRKGGNEILFWKRIQTVHYFCLTMSYLPKLMLY